MFGYPKNPVVWIAVCIFVISVLLFIISIFIYEYTKKESEEVSFWIWFLLIGSISLLVISILMYAAGNKQFPNYREIIVYEKGWDKNIQHTNGRWSTEPEIKQIVQDPLNPFTGRINNMQTYTEI